MEVIGKVGPAKYKRIRGNPQEKVNSLIWEKFIIRGKLSKKYKKFKLHEDKEIHKIAQYNVQNIIAEKRFWKKTHRACQQNWRLMKALKALRLTEKSGIFIISALDLEHDTRSTLKTF